MTRGRAMVTGSSLGTVVAPVVLCLVAASCTWVETWRKPDLVVPRWDTASAQYSYAAKIDATTLVGRDTPRRREKLREVIAAYQAVLDNYPEDRYHTPLAHASIANCYYDMGEYRKTIKLYQEAEQHYPNYTFIHAQAEWKIGQACEKLGWQREAKRHYKRCIDTFRHNKNNQIQKFVRLSMERYAPPAIEGKVR